MKLKSLKSSVERIVNFTRLKTFHGDNNGPRAEHFLIGIIPTATIKSVMPKFQNGSTAILPNLLTARKRVALKNHRCVNTVHNVGRKSAVYCLTLQSRFHMSPIALNDNRNEGISVARSKGTRGSRSPIQLWSIIGITGNRFLQSNLNGTCCGTPRSSFHSSAVELKNCTRIGVESDELVDFATKQNNKNIPVVIGGSIMDVCYTVADYPLELDGATYHSTTKMYGGGVGRNIAEGLSKLHGSVNFITKIGNDQQGDSLLKLLPDNCRLGIERDSEHPTASCSVIIDSCGEVKLHLANFDINNKISPEMVIKHERIIASAPIIVFDANISTDTMATILDLCHKYKKPAFFEPTDMRIASKPFTLPKHLIRQIKFMSPNIYELHNISKQLNSSNILQNTNASIEPYSEESSTFLQEIKSSSARILELVDNVLVTLGPKGVVLMQRDQGVPFSNKYQSYDISSQENGKKLIAKCKLYDIEKVCDIVNLSGAGDSFNVGFITALINGYPDDTCISVGFECARSAMRAEGAVPAKYIDWTHQCWKNHATFKII